MSNRKHLVVSLAIMTFLAGSILTSGARADAAPAAHIESAGQPARSAAVLHDSISPRRAAVTEQSDGDFPYCNERRTQNTGGSVYNYYPAYEDVHILTARCIMEEGSTGGGVTNLQESLDQCYGQGLDIDGAFGPATYNALLAVQRQIGVTIDGVYGPDTGRAMFHTGDSCRHIEQRIFDE